jgi:hypothetical protein
MATGEWPITPNLALQSLATNTLARQAALKAAKHQLQAEGLRVSQFTPSELRLRAEACLAAHREELVAEAKEIVVRWQAAGVFGKRGGIHFPRRAKLKKSRTTPEGLNHKGFCCAEFTLKMRSRK